MLMGGKITQISVTAEKNRNFISASIKKPLITRFLKNHAKDRSAYDIQTLFRSSFVISIDNLDIQIPKI